MVVVLGSEVVVVGAWVVVWNKVVDGENVVVGDKVVF